MEAQHASFTGSIPEHYDRHLGPILFDDFAADAAARVAAGAPGRVLELAAGTGILTRRLRDLLPPQATLTATDLNPPMLEAARAKFRDGENVAFQPADATELPFPDGTFDAVVCQFGIMFFPDKDKSYREVHRVLAAGGRYVFSVWDSHRRNPIGGLIHETIAGFFPADPPAFFQVPFAYHRIDPIKEALIEAGFGDMRAAVLRLEKEVPDPGGFARGFVFGSPVIDQIRARGGIDPDHVVTALADAFGREFGTEPCRVGLQTIVFEATRA